MSTLSKVFFVLLFVVGSVSAAIIAYLIFTWLSTAERVSQVIVGFGIIASLAVLIVYFVAKIREVVRS